MARLDAGTGDPLGTLLSQGSVAHLVTTWPNRAPWCLYCTDDKDKPLQTQALTPNKHNTTRDLKGSFTIPAPPTKGSRSSVGVAYINPLTLLNILSITYRHTA